MIHQYKMNGLNIVLDVNSGAIHVVDDLVYDILPFYENTSHESILNILSERYKVDEVREGLDEIKELTAQGLLFSTNDGYEQALTGLETRNPVIKALCLHVAHDCNLKCTYCFAQEGEYQGKRELMSADIGKAALDFLVAHSGERKNLEVDFFGGEPLMNITVVKEIVAYGHSLEKDANKKFRFTITTNGVLLNERTMDFINQEMDNVVLSIDGRKEINDYMRPTGNGKGSYDIIMGKFQQLAEKRQHKNYYVRGTFTKHNLDFSQDVLHLADMGFKQISVEPVVAEEGEPYAITEKDLPQIYDEYENLAIQLLERKQNNKDFVFFHYMLDLTGGPCVYKRLIGCGAGTEYLAVTPTGALYPCHQFVGQEEFHLGDVYNGILENSRKKEFENLNVYAKPDCQDCWAKFYCSGGCAANAHQYGGHLKKPYTLGCKLQKKRVECAVMMKIKESMCSPEK